MTDSERFDLLLSKIESLGTSMDQRFSAMEQRFDAMDERISGMDGRISGMDGRISAMDERVSSLESTLTKEIRYLGKRVESLEKTVESLDKRLGSLEMTVENEVIPSIKAVAEGHFDVLRKLDEALKVEKGKELLIVRQLHSENEISKIKARLDAAGI